MKYRMRFLFENCHRVIEGVRYIFFKKGGSLVETKSDFCFVWVLTPKLNYNSNDQGCKISSCNLKIQHEIRLCTL